MQVAARARDGGNYGQIVVRNTVYLTVAQALTVPLSIIINSVAAQYLGAKTFGYGYLVGTLCGFGYLVVGWGHEAVLPSVIARDHSVAGRMLGSSLAWRAVLSVAVYLLLALACYFANYPAEVQWALGLTALMSAINSMTAAYKDAIRGFERTDIPAYAHVAQQVIATVLVCLVLVAGGRLNAALSAQTVAAAIVLLATVRALRSVGVERISVDWDTLKTLTVSGVPFMALGFAMTLQPSIDALFLSKMAPPEVMGWFGVSRRLVGALLLPATALLGALYPTLCRLHGTDLDAFRRATSGALRSVSVVVVPAALGCALFPDIGVALFSRTSFRPAEDNLRIMSVFVALVYFSMPLGISIMAAGRQRAWSIVQSLCVVSALILDPLLIPIFQTHYGNGGLGLCVAAAISEAIIIAFGIAMAPRGIFDRAFGRLLLVVSLSGVAMAIVGYLALPLSSYVAAPLALVAYAVVLWFTGGFDANHVNGLRKALGRPAAAPTAPPRSPGHEETTCSTLAPVR
jgi:O-antigen/teichoic acid export membrane protein